MPRIAKRRRVFRYGALSFAILLAVSAMPVAAGNSYQCDGGSNAAIVNACAVRWEAANIRAHVAQRDFGGSTPSCLLKTASLFDELAAKWLRTNHFTAFAGTWPCGKDPSVAKADDGLLDQLCPGRAWSYDNKGVSGCNVSRSLAQAQQPMPQQAPQATPQPIDFDGLANALASGSHYYRWWNGGAVDTGDYHDVTVSNTVSFNGCDFEITSNTRDFDGRSWHSEWSGNLRDVNVNRVWVYAIPSRPANWGFNFETIGRASRFTYTGTNSDGASHAGFVLPFNPQSALTTFKTAVQACKT